MSHDQRSVGARARAASRAAAAFACASLAWVAAAGATEAGVTTDRCATGERWDAPMAMCMPAIGPDAAGTALSAQFQASLVLSGLPGPRGNSGLAAPNHFMLAATRATGANQQLSLVLMGTGELWSYPATGYPELLQVGEQRANGQPFIDAQHPHSSPIMGLTLGYQWDFSAARSLGFSFAPRGASTDGPIAFMHRASARDNPDAPLGHHVGQDVGHISSTVLATQLVLGRVTLEASAFNGSEPAPTHVDLPLGRLDSGGARVTLAFAPTHRLMASLARVRQQDEVYPGSQHATRWSASWQDDARPTQQHGLDHSLVLGLIQRDGSAATLRSVLDEGVLGFGRTEAWWRVEALERLGTELGIPQPGDSPRWVQALTLGATRWSAPRRAWQLGIGASLTLDRVPEAWSAAYGARMPLTARLIVQLRADGRWRP